MSSLDEMNPSTGKRFLNRTPEELFEVLKHTWDVVRDSFRPEISNTATDLFLGELRVTAYEEEADGSLNIVLTGDSVVRIWTVHDKYLGEIERRFSEQMGCAVKVRLISNKACDEIARKRGYSLNEPLIILEPDEETAKAGGENGDCISGAAPEILRDEHGRVTTITAAQKALQELRSQKQETSEPEKADAPEEPKNTASDRKPPSTLPPFNFEYTFDNFIVGSSNKFAHAACLAVADHPAQSYNPLFIYGPSGLGKTHLLYAITNELKRKNERIKVIYIKGENFTNHMIESLSRQAMKEFRDMYRSCDVLLIDDIQFIAGKTSTQEEFFHTFNALYEDGKQIILTSDRPPREIKTLEDRLKTRFEWGLIADIQPPDLELRTAIIKKKADQVNLELPDDVLTFLAENLRSNVRQIEGAIKKLGAMSFLSGQEINMSVARSCIADLLDGAEPVNVTVDKVFSAVYHKYGIQREELVSSRRTKEIASARHVSVYLIRKITDMSLPNIGKIFNRDHSTIISSLEAVEKRRLQSDSFRLELEGLEKEVRGS